MRVKPWVASGETPLPAVIVKSYAPPLPAAGVPVIVAVPSGLSVKVTPLGRVASPSLSEGVGAPVVVTVKLPKVPAVKMVSSSLVIVGAAGLSTVRVKSWVASAETPLLAVTVKS